MVRVYMVLALASVALAGCKSEDIEYWPEPEYPDAGADVALDVSGEDTGEEDLQWAGRACESDSECREFASGTQCVDRSTLDGFGVNDEIQLPGGMCSKLLCQSDDDCGPDGTCFDAAALGAPVDICLASCEDIRDCRWQEGWDCVPLSLVSEGAEGGACVSDSLQVAILCDDGSCEEPAEGSGE